MDLAHTGEEWIAAGEQGSTAPCHGCEEALKPLSTAEDKGTRDNEKLVLSKCLASPQKLQVGQGVLVRAPQGWRSGQWQGMAVAVLYPQ